MGVNVLIVEDQFIEANDLKLSLQSAGHWVSGIAKSYQQALLSIDRQRPDIVLLDIYLKDKGSGLDLAMVLGERNIPFIYVSANSDPAILEATSATKSYGFLVKPFRERDLLIAMDTAAYRHKQATELTSRQEQIIKKILSGISTENIGVTQKLLRVVQTLNPYIPFDHVHIDIDIKNEDLDSVFCFRRTGFDEYEFNTGWQITAKYQINSNWYIDWRKNTALSNVTKIENSKAFDEACEENPFLSFLRKKFGVNSRLIAPLLSKVDVQMGIRFYSVQPQSFKPEHLELVYPLRPLLAMVLENIRNEKGGGQDGPYLPAEAINHSYKPVTATNGIVGKSPKLLQALDYVTQVAEFDTSVLILGETGVGKEGLAKAIHQQSSRSAKPLIKINCAAIPVTLIESELFGHEKGSFTGAVERRIGKFEQAQGGTIFLDEVGEIPLEVQTKLLRVLQEKEFERIGGRTTIKADVRVIAATNRNLQKDVASGKFRIDLYYRINAFPIILAPLRERKEDIPLLAEYFLQQHAKNTNSPVKRLSPAVLGKLVDYSWPGNIRELQHVIERGILLNTSLTISSIELPDDPIQKEPVTLPASSENLRTIADVDRAHIISVLKKCNGRVSGKGGAAEMLDIPATTLNSKMKKLGIARKPFF